MITLTELQELVLNNSNQTQIEGFVCVGYGFNEYKEGVPEYSLMDKLGVEYHDMYMGECPFGGERMVKGAYGALEDTLYYITVAKYAQLHGCASN